MKTNSSIEGYLRAVNINKAFTFPDRNLKPDLQKGTALDAG